MNAARYKIICAAALALLLNADKNLSAQTQPDSQPQTVLHSSNLPSMMIGCNDLLQVSVYESPELTGSIRVDEHGDVYIPMLKDPVQAQGLYSKQLEQKIAESLVSAHLIVNPVVTVTVLEYQSLTVTVAGAVRQPVSFQAYGSVSLMDALVKAQGLSADAGEEVLVISHPSAGQVPLIRRIPIKDLMSGKSPVLNVALHGGEEIRVVEQGRISVVGNVRKPGLYPIHSGNEATVLNAIAESEGLLPYASKHAYIYRLQSSSERKSEISVELEKIMDRKSQDIALVPGDILYVPDNHTRRATLGTLDKLLTAGSGAGAALVYAGVR